MAEFTPDGQNLRWSSLDKREKRLFGIFVAGVSLGGFAIGFLWGDFKDADAPQSTALRIALALSPMLPFIAAGWAWIRLTSTQDELFKRVGTVASKLGYWISLAVIVPAGLLEGLAGIEVLPLWGAALVVLAAPSVGAYIAAKRYLQ